jgi:hypothetical protein
MLPISLLFCKQYNHRIVQYILSFRGNRGKLKTRPNGISLRFRIIEENAYMVSL